MRRGLLLLAVAAVAAVTVAPPASAHSLTLRAALIKTGQVARAAGLATGATQYYAFGCARRSAHVVDCVGAVVYPDDGACGQIVRISYKNHAAKTVRAARLGSPLCGYPGEDEYPEPSGGEPQTAICGIRGLVCIPGN